LFSPGAGFPADTDGAGTMAARTINAGTGISVANGAGAAGNPTISYDSAVVGLFSSGTGDVPATGALARHYYETDKPAGYFYPATDTEHWILSVPPASIAQGDVFYASGAHTLARLAAGTSGQFLQTQGAATNPQWADASAVFNPGTSWDFYDEMMYPNVPATVPQNWIETAFSAGAATRGIGSSISDQSVWSIINPAADNGGSSFRTGAIQNPTAQDWELDAKFRASSVTSMGIWIGLLNHSTAGSRNPLLAENCIWMRFDTDQSDTNFTFQIGDAAGAAGCQSADDDTDSAIIASTVAADAAAWHRVRIRMDQTGVGGNPTIYARVDSETEVTFCSSGCTDVIADMPATSVGLWPFFACGTRDATGVEVCSFEYFRISGTRP